jgi:hypothetical protein
VLVLVPSVGQGAWDGSITYIRFSGAVGLPEGVVLPAGEYTFEAVRRDVVRVMSRDRLQVFYTGFTIPVQRPRDLERDGMISLGERAADGVPTIRAWYPTSIGTGHAFMYK